MIICQSENILSDNNSYHLKCVLCNLEYIESGTEWQFFNHYQSKHPSEFSLLALQDFVFELERWFEDDDGRVMYRRERWKLDLDVQLFGVKYVDETKEVPCF